MATLNFFLKINFARLDKIVLKCLKLKFWICELFKQLFVECEKKKKMYTYKAFSHHQTKYFLRCVSVKCYHCVKVASMQRLAMGPILYICGTVDTMFKPLTQTSTLRLNGSLPLSVLCTRRTIQIRLQFKTSIQTVQHSSTRVANCFYHL